MFLQSRLVSFLANLRKKVCKIRNFLKVNETQFGFVDFCRFDGAVLIRQSQGNFFKVMLFKN